MSMELEGADLETDAVFGVNASRVNTRMAQTSKTLADESQLVKLAGVERRCRSSSGTDVFENRNGLCELKRGIESDFGSETENDSDDFYENRGVDCSGKLESKLENLGDVVLAGSENLKLSDSDLVWGKVSSYPWWPGQVFSDASVASDKAMKYFKKGNFLVAYFGDSSFAWNHVSKIKPFHQHFSQMVKQSDSPEFRNAVDCALEEVSRRVEFGLSCGCVSEEAYNRAKTQIIVNPGIREDSCVRYGGDKLSNAIVFEPTKLVEYMKHLACFPRYDETDELQFVNKRAQLLAFQQWTSHHNFPKYETFLRSVESAGPLASLPEPNTDEEASPKESKTEEKNLSGCIAKKHFPSSRTIKKLDGKSHSDKKRKVKSLESGKPKKKIKNNRQEEDSVSRNSDDKNNSSVGNKLKKVTEPCFLMGAIPLREESEMNLSTPTPKPCGGSKSTSKVEAENKKTKKPGLEMLSSLHSAKARKEVPESLSLKHSNYAEFDQFLKERSTLNDDSKKVSITEISDQKMLPVSKDITDSGSKEQTGLQDCSADPSAPNALILKFASSCSVPSEEKLNSIFNRYGPLRESETRVMKKGKSKRAKVVFKRGEDAKTAFSSSGKYSIFGPSLLSYSLKFVCPKAK